MNIYSTRFELGSDGNSKFCRMMLCNDRDRSELNNTDLFNGRAIDSQAWKPWAIQRADTTPNNLRKPLGDRAGLDFKTDPMLLSSKAIQILGPHISKFAQLLPLSCDDYQYSLCNVTNVVDALDEVGSDVWRFPSSGRIGNVKKYVFRRNEVNDEWIFKIPQQPKGYAFVTDRFVELVSVSGLTGFEFELLWTGES
jgi:hypothetical protein